MIAYAYAKALALALGRGRRNDVPRCPPELQRCSAQCLAHALRSRNNAHRTPRLGFIYLLYGSEQLEEREQYSSKNRTRQLEVQNRSNKPLVVLDDEARITRRDNFEASLPFLMTIWPLLLKKPATWHLS